MPIWCYSHLCKECFWKHRHSAIHELSSGMPCSNERKNIRYAHNILRSLNCGRIRNYISILRMFLETSSLCYPRTLFRQALFERTEKYPICSQYTQNCGRVRNYISILHNVEILISEFNAKPLILTPYDNSKCRITLIFSKYKTFCRARSVKCWSWYGYTEIYLQVQG